MPEHFREQLERFVNCQDRADAQRRAMQTYHKSLTEWRRVNKLNLREAAKILRVSFTYLCKVERGRMPITEPLARALLREWKPIEEVSAGRGRLD